jgi:hypothetical protein
MQHYRRADPGDAARFPRGTAGSESGLAGGCAGNHLPKNKYFRRAVAALDK